MRLPADRSSKVEEAEEKEEDLPPRRRDDPLAILIMTPFLIILHIIVSID